MSRVLVRQILHRVNQNSENVLRFSRTSEMAHFKPVTHVIFDMDGLLLDTEAMYEKAISQITGKFGKPYLWETKVKVMGKTYPDSIRTVIGELGLPITVEEYGEELDEISMQLFPHCNLLPGVEKLINHLHSHKVPIAIATSSKDKSYKVKIEKHQPFIDLFSHVVCGSSDDSVKAGKPAPDIFLVCSSRFPDNPDPEKVLVFEDSPNGVEAALAANMQVVMIPDQRLDLKDCTSPTLALRSMEDFDPELFGLPPFSK